MRPALRDTGNPCECIVPECGLWVQVKVHNPRDPGAKSSGPSADREGQKVRGERRRPGGLRVLA